jgi:hypothetical protein
MSKNHATSTAEMLQELATELALEQSASAKIDLQGQIVFISRFPAAAGLVKLMSISRRGMVAANSLSANIVLLPHQFGPGQETLQP